MRILTFLHSFEPGDVERLALRLVRRWRAMGIDAPLFLGREDGALRAEFADGLAYEAPRQPVIGTAAWETLWMILRLPGAIRRLRPDAIFVAGSTYSVVAVAMALLLGKRCPPIVARISNDLARRDLTPIARRGWRLWLAAQARSARIWVIIDEAIADDLPAEMARRARVIHDPAIEEAQISAGRARRPAGPHRFVAIGGLEARKDYPLMIRAFANGAHPGDTLTIFGDGGERRALEALVAALGQVDRIRFAGHVPDAAARLAGFDILLLSSRYEGVPAVAVAALAAGLPVIATDCGAGVRSLLGHGRHGRIARRTEAALTAEIDDAAAAPATHVSRLSHLRRFTIECAAQAYIDAFAEVAGAGEPAIAHRIQMDLCR